MYQRPNLGRQAATGPSARPASWEDADLIAKIREGQTEHYGTLVRKYQDRVFNTCWRICGHLEDARDVTQEAFLKGYEHLGEFRQQSGFYTWIYRVAVNLALSHRRAAKRRSSVLLDGASDVAGTQAATLAGHAAADDPEKAISDREIHACVVRALHALDDDQRAVVVLRDIEGFDYREIGEILDIPPGTVKSRLHRARSTIAQALGSSAAAKE